MEAIRKYLQNLFPLDENDLNYFLGKLKRVKLATKQTLLQKGEIELNLSFIEKGVVRLFIPSIEKETTIGFVFENDFVTAYESFITQKPSIYKIETLSETILWQITFEDLEKVYNHSKNGNLIGRKMAEKQFLTKAKRELSLLEQTAEERYLDLFKLRPEVVKKIPLKYIASYIGISPQALSRIRKRIN